MLPFSKKRTNYYACKKTRLFYLEEFCKVIGVSDKVINELRDAYENHRPVDKVVHEQMMSVVNLYLIVGGMPAAVNAKNKRFILKKLNENFKLSRYQNSFIWMWKAGVAIPTFNVTEPVAPLKLNQQRNLFKLFQNDVDLLAYQYSNGIQMELRSETGIRPLQREPHRTRRHTQSSYLHDNVLQEGRSLDRAIQARHQRLIGITGACYVDGIWNQEDPEKWLTIIQVPVRK